MIGTGISNELKLNTVAVSSAYETSTEHVQIIVTPAAVYVFYQGYSPPKDS